MMTDEVLWMVCLSFGCLGRKVVANGLGWMKITTHGEYVKT